MSEGQQKQAAYSGRPLISSWAIKLSTAESSCRGKVQSVKPWDLVWKYCWGWERKKLTSCFWLSAICAVLKQHCGALVLLVCFFHINLLSAGHSGILTILLFTFFLLFLEKTFVLLHINMYHHASGSHMMKEQPAWRLVSSIQHTSQKTKQCKHIALSYKISDLLYEHLHSVDINVCVLLWRNENPESPTIVRRGEKQMSGFVLKYVKAPVGCRVSGRPCSDKAQNIMMTPENCFMTEEVWWESVTLGNTQKHRLHLSPDTWSFA